MMHHPRVNDVLEYLHMHFDSFFVRKLVKIREVSMANYLILIVSKAEEYHWLAMLESRVYDL